jgi:hypothetical protein
MKKTALAYYMAGDIVVIFEVGGLASEGHS